MIINDVRAEIEAILQKIIRKKKNDPEILREILLSGNKLKLDVVREKFPNEIEILDILVEANILRISIQQNENVFYQFHSKKMQRAYEQINEGMIVQFI